MSDSPGRREVAFRVFAAEFDDATVEYKESDEERAPNYVITPGGARVNRLFLVGVLTEVEQVSEDVLRGRVVDPTGAFVVYAGQYQPDEQSFLERAEPPTFVAVTGKARTFEPEDGDRIYTSVRPESINEVDAETRDRWVVDAAARTLERVATMARALDSDARGEDLERRLRDGGVQPGIAAGIPLAIDRYDTTPYYLAGLRDLSIDAARVVAGEIDEVEPFDRAPDESGEADLAALADAAPEEATVTALTESAPDRATGPGGVTDTATAAADTDETTEGAGEDTASPDASGERSTSDVGAEPSTTDVAEERAPDVGEESSTTDASEETTTDVGEETAGVDEGTETDAGAGATGDTGVDAETAPTSTDEHAGSGNGDEESAVGTGDLGDFEAGDLDDEGEAETEEMYELDEDERREVEEEFGTEFSTGAEVASGEDELPDEEIETPEESAEATDVAAEAPESGSTGSEDAHESADETATEAAESKATETPEETATTDESDEAGVEAELDEGTAATDGATDDGAETGGGSAEDVDLEDAVIERMEELDDGDGADREELIAAVVDATGADPDAVEDAIQDALMGGRCYEPADGKLKSI